MPVLEWDAIGTKAYETGVDRGVLYLSDGTAVPWNGLTEVVEKFDKSVTPVYYDGMKIADWVENGDFSATMKAFTYPEEFTEFEGIGKLNDGLYVGDQPPKTFSLSYRTRVGNDVDGPEVGHKIHIIYNLVAIPNDKTFGTVADNISPVEFQWTISSVPEDIPGIRPTSHIIIDTTDFDPRLLEVIEGMIYGNDDEFAALIPMSNLLSFMSDWYRENPPPPPLITISYLGDGLWTASTDAPGLIIDHGDGTFTINDANAIFAGDLYEISDTIS